MREILTKFLYEQNHSNSVFTLYLHVITIPVDVSILVTIFMLRNVVCLEMIDDSLHACATAHNENHVRDAVTPLQSGRYVSVTARRRDGGPTGRDAERRFT